MLKDLVNNDVFIVANSGAPTDGTSGTGVGLAGPGSLLVDYSNLALYQNTNTKASPTWTKTTTLTGTQTLTNKTLTSPIINTATINQANMFLNSNSFAAAGNNQGNATAMNQNAPGVILATAADGTKGVRLVFATPVGLLYFVKNDDAANAILKVYPATGDAINALAVNASYDMAAKTSVIFMCVVAGTWLTIPLVAS